MVKEILVGTLLVGIGYGIGRYMADDCNFNTNYNSDEDDELSLDTTEETENLEDEVNSNSNENLKDEVNSGILNRFSKMSGLNIYNDTKRQ